MNVLKIMGSIVGAVLIIFLCIQFIDHLLEKKKIRIENENLINNNHSIESHNLFKIRHTRKYAHNDQIPYHYKKVICLSDIGMTSVYKLKR